MATLSPAVEDYLKTIYKAQRGDARPVSTQVLAERLDVAAPSITAMVKKLAALNLVEYEPYHGVSLTEAGKQIALEVIRHHRIVETYLAEVLGVPWDKVHEEADRLEHVLSEEVEARMAEALGNPTRDPHGAPIPTLNGEVADDAWQSLLEVEAGASVTVRRVSDQNPDLLRHLLDLDLVPGSNVKVVRAEPTEGLLKIKVNGQRKVVGNQPAQSVWVEGNSS